MKKNELKILDCTLRDGGYYNSWDFSKEELIEDYLQAMSAAKIEYVELGFRFLKKDICLGLCIYNTFFFKTLNIPKDLKIGIMINAKDIISNNLSNAQIDKNFLILKKKDFLCEICLSFK